jgi:ornithine cyclodeaminase/alanine dehydrogenase-like protein (mu-crystallin family)
MKNISAAGIRRSVGYRDLVEALRAAFRGDVVTPLRHHHAIERAGRAGAMLLLMPAWTAMAQGAEKGYAGLKTVMVVPDNVERGKPTVQGAYLLFSGETGEALALLDGTELTRMRTAAASALAADYLARKDAGSLLMVGAGALAPHLIRAHAEVRPIRRVRIWNRRPKPAAALARRLARQGFDAAAVDDLETAVRDADIVSCATLSTEPLVRGAWLQPGQHLDLVGAFTPEMRESDDEAMRRARIHVDTREGALSEAGDLIQPMRSGAIAQDAIRGDLFDLARDRIAGRTGADEITAFKSCGTALEDLAAAILVYERAVG